jgi:hypothetical protein
MTKKFLPVKKQEFLILLLLLNRKLFFIKLAWFSGFPADGGVTVAVRLSPIFTALPID